MGGFTRRVEFYTGKRQKLKLTVTLRWWDLRYLLDHYLFVQAHNGIWLDYDLETDAATIRQMTEYFLALTNDSALYQDPLYQKEIAENLQDLEKGLKLRYLSKINVAVREWGM